MSAVSNRTRPAPIRRSRAGWRVGVSLAALTVAAVAGPASAQTAAARLAARSAMPRPTVQAPSAGPIRTGIAREALTRQRATLSRAEQIRAYVLSVRDAARAAEGRAAVTDGLGAAGLDPTDKVRQAVAAAAAGDTRGAGVLLVSASAAADATGTTTWEGAGLPRQTASGVKTTVEIDQTQQRALLTWNAFNVGANTTLQFNQQSQPGWVAVNRVSNAVAPSQILGNVKAAGTVVVLNQAGVIFGKTAQVNTHSLLASTLELGNSARFVSGTSGPTQAATLKERNSAYLQNGLFLPANGTFFQLGADNFGAAVLVSAPGVDDGRSFAETAGGITVDAGAKIATNGGGFIIMAAPTIDTAGELTAVEGQVSLQAGYAVNYTQSTGAASDPDPNVRGYKLNTLSLSGQAGGTINAGGIIDSSRGYLSLGTGALGSVTVSGLLQTTTSVSRNGKISLTSGNVTLAGAADPTHASGIAMLADTNGETIPRGSPNEPATFRTSQLEIGTQLTAVPGEVIGALVPTNFTMGQNALIVAPNADVAIGATTLKQAVSSFLARFPGTIAIASGATIDVSGLKDVQLDASRNQIAITPVKRNELRDTPNYREVAVDGNFTLNGATLYVDPRLSGVRADGVAWVGSPLIEAGSLAGQISSTAAEFMTKGGTVKLITGLQQGAGGAQAGSAVKIASGATIDFSGGWVSYAAGAVKTSRLITDDGRVVDIGRADPNDVYVGVAEGFTQVQPRFGVVRTYFNTIAQGLRVDPAYDEGRQAGTLQIFAPGLAIDGTFYGNSFAGSRQLIASDRPTAAATLAGDPRRLQLTPYQLPPGGWLSIASQGDMLVYHGTRGATESNPGQALLSDAMLSGAGLSGLSLITSGGVTFANAGTATLQPAGAVTLTGASDLTLLRGGTLNVLAGSTITFDGNVTATSGAIVARTQSGLLANTGSAIDIAGGGSVFVTAPAGSNRFDILVGGALSTAGQWANDFNTTGLAQGRAFGDGGSISLTVQPSFFILDPNDSTRALDRSGSIRVTGLLDVQSGGYVTPTGGLVLTGTGGDVSLVNATTYASTRLTDSGLLIGDSGGATSNQPIGGNNQSVDFTSIAGPYPVRAALVPDPLAVVDIAGATIRGFGFAGGGAFTLVSPNVSFGSDTRAGSTHIGLDFFRQTGFGTLNVTSNRSRIVGDLFTNESARNSAFLETTRFEVRGGETFDLTQWMLPSILTSSQGIALRGLATGASLSAVDFLAPTRMAAAFDQRAANLVLGGLTELDVLQGGAIVGAAGASLTVDKLYNAGSIILPGGTISQRLDVTDNLLVAGLGVRDTDLGGRGLADAFGGPVDAQGRFDEGAANAGGLVDPAEGTTVLTNRELVSRDGADRLIYFLGRLGAGQGVVLAGGSTTDLSGTAIFNPRTPFQANGVQIRTGSVVDGGSIRLAAAREVSRPVSLVASAINAAATIERSDGAALNISGASAIVDQPTRFGGFTPYLEWSAAGTISALGGGTLGNTPIAARGGVASAEGGTLEWINPTVGAGSAGIDYLSAAMIAGSGFDSLVARGSLTLDGTFSLGLRKALMVTSQDPLQSGILIGDDAIVTIGATAGTNATISAGYIRFESRVKRVAGSGEVEANAPTLRFVAGAQGIDVVGGIGFGGATAIGATTLATPGDVRFTGIDEGQDPLPSYDGQLVASGDLTIDAGRTYATTGTGNLQALLEGLAPTDPTDPINRTLPYDIRTLGTHTITFGNTYLNAAAPAPLSAGTHLRVLSARIAQNGYLAAPLGLLELGATQADDLTAATTSLTFGAGSVTTVSGAGLNVPYGTTTDLVEYFFPTVGKPITVLPTGQLRLAGASIVESEGARIDGRGGGDVFAYEFQSGVGGSRDVLDRFNRDPFSAKGYDPAAGFGYQYADRRQVFALIPADQASKIAQYDPTFSADYGASGPVDLYGASAGLSVRLESAPGVAGGDYLMVPAKYAAAIPGALRLVENNGAAVPLPGTSTTLLDGSVIVAGTLGYAGTGIAESTRRSFTIQTKDVFLKYSQIQTTSGSKTIADLAAKNGVARPRLPLDAARVILSPLNELRVAGVFDTTAAEGGQGGQFDILGTRIAIVAAGQSGPAGTLTLTDTSLANLNATSLLIGGQRSDGANGATVIDVSARSVDVLGGATLRAPEVLLVATGTGSRVALADGASVVAGGTLGTQPAGDYTLASGGALLRVANGGERFVTRTGTGAGTIQIGAATVVGTSIALDTSGTVGIANAAVLRAPDVAAGQPAAELRIALSGPAIQFLDGADGVAGAIGSALEGKLAAANYLTVRSRGAIRFAAGVEHRFNNLILDTAAIGSAGGVAADTVTLTATGNLTLLNSTAAAPGCSAICGAAGTLALNADTLTFGSNAVTASGFANGVTLAAANGMYVEGKGSFATGASALTLATPFVVERSGVADPRAQTARPDYSFLTTGAFVLRGSEASVAPAGNAAPGARIAIGSEAAPVASATLLGGLIRATAGIIDIRSASDVVLAGDIRTPAQIAAAPDASNGVYRGVTLSTPGYLATFGDSADAVTVAAGAGTINLVSNTGSILAPRTNVPQDSSIATLIADSGVGSAGRINLLAGAGTVALGDNVVLNAGVTGARAGAIAVDTGRGAFDLAGFVARYGALFGGDVSIRAGRGDLTLAAGQTWKAQAVKLVAEGGAITIGGTIDTSGVSVAGLTADAARNARVDGGDIALWGAGGVTLQRTAVLDAHTTGYAESDTRPAKAGDVTLGIGNATASLTIAPGAVIDVGARRTQAALAAGEPGGRLVPQVITDPTTGSLRTVYRYAQPDEGGTVFLRAPVIGAAGDKVSVTLGGSIVGAGEVQLEGFRRYNLDQLASGNLYSGVTLSNGTIVLDMTRNAANSGGKSNPFTEAFTLADGTPSVVSFVQDFAVSTVDGSSLSGVRLRPGVELGSTRSVSTSSQWNLAAASFSPQQLQDAVAAGVLVINAELSKPNAPVYSVVVGREGDLLASYSSFVYRVGGTAAGEAPVVTLRAGGSLTVNRSISDGFFAFRDKSDAGYVSYQLGGGDRTYSRALSFSCLSGFGSCGEVVSYQDGVANGPGPFGGIAISLNGTALTGAPAQGGAFTNSPLAIAGNGVSGSSIYNSGTGATAENGDALGFAELFPLLPDGSAMRSSDLRLVGGAGPTLSVDPLHVERAIAGNVTVTGSYAYQLSATGSGRYGGPLQFQLLQPAGGNAVNFNVGNTLGQTDTTGGLNQLSGDAYTTLTWGGGTNDLNNDARAFAQTYFAGSGYTFTGSSTRPSGINAPLSAIIGFLQAFEATYQSGFAANRTGYNQAAVPVPRQFSSTPSVANVRSYVRSGDGAIAVAAARDVDLRGSATPTYLLENGATGTATDPGSGQFAAAAIYTAGVRAAASNVTARINGGGLVSIALDSPYLAIGAEQIDFLPGLKSLSDTTPVIATGGGGVAVTAGRDVLGNRDTWSEQFLGTGSAFTDGGLSSNAGTTIGSATQRWRTGIVGADTEIGLAPRYFTSGIGALAGGDVSIAAGRNLSQLTVALDSAATTATTDAGQVLLAYGSGNLTMTAGQDILAGRFDVSTGAAAIAAGRNVTSLGTEFGQGGVPVAQYLRVRLTDAVVNLSARGAATVGSVSALGSDDTVSSAGYFSPTGSFGLSATEQAQIAQTQVRGTYGLVGSFLPPEATEPSYYVAVLPPSLAMTSFSGSVVLPDSTRFSLSADTRQLLYPSPIGQLRLFSDGDMSRFTIAMSDADPVVLAGAFSPNTSLTAFAFPYVTANTSDATLRAQHNQLPTHLGDGDPVRIYSNGDIDRSALFLPKQARITAGGDIIDMFFSGQNLLASDITRIRAGGDITGTLAIDELPFVQSNNFILGGPGTLIVEAGRNLGPFVTSANVEAVNGGITYSFGGGIRTIGNDYNPWLAETGAAISARFGIAAGADYTALRQTYVDPANLANLDGDLFEQVTDAFGNLRPDRARPIYAPILAQWLLEQAPDQFYAVFGRTNPPTTTSELTAAAYGRFADLYAQFLTVDPLRQQDFLINRVYFNELGQVGNPEGPSFNQYIRGYRAVQTLFPPSLGYTDNLSVYDAAAAETINADHPLGEPVHKTAADGSPIPANRIVTGSVDLRLSTIQTVRGGDVSILGPGGDVIAGSVVRTADQAARRGTAFIEPIGADLPPLEAGLFDAVNTGGLFASIPLGLEGVLTLRGGQIRSFTDGNFLLNQSRVFTQQGGDITMWSSNGDLAAGQGPKSASNFPPVTVRFDENGLAEVNSAGSVAGAGIGTFKRTPADPASQIVLLAPVGLVDAGDAGVRASGRVVVVAARVGNSDSFSGTGGLVGVPTAAVTASVATPASAASAVAAQAANAAAGQNQADLRSLISVDVLGPLIANSTGDQDDQCKPGDTSPECRNTQRQP